MNKKNLSRNKVEIIINLLLSTLLLIIYISVVFIKGTIGATAWSLSLLILSPLAVILSIVYLIRIVIAIIKKKRMKCKLLTLALSLVFSYPVLILIGISSIVYPVSGKENPSIEIEIPFTDKEGLILKGGKDHRIHAVWASECYAYDILKAPYDIDATNLDDFGIYGEEVIAPVEGVIIAAFDKEEDIPPNQQDFISEAGNYIYMKINETGTYLLFGHLKQHSITVETGDYVKVGDVIGRVGNSGTTSEPHLHLQHQRENPLKVLHSTCAEGLPIRFTD